jgi:hypothetical protein
LFSQKPKVYCRVLEKPATSTGYMPSSPHPFTFMKLELASLAACLAARLAPRTPLRSQTLEDGEAARKVFSETARESSLAEVNAASL